MYQVIGHLHPVALQQQEVLLLFLGNYKLVQQICEHTVLTCNSPIPIECPEKEKNATIEIITHHYTENITLHFTNQYSFKLMKK